jgi:hypothetical protein
MHRIFRHGMRPRRPLPSQKLARLLCSLTRWLAHFRINRSMLDTLLQFYREIGLALPPGDAPLVCISRGGYLRGRHEEPLELCDFAFWLNHQTPDQPPQILLGPARFAMDSDTRGKLEPIGPDATPAIQCHERGLSKFAMKLAEVSIWSQDPRGGPGAVRSDCAWIDPRESRVDFSGDRDLPPRQLLAGLAWNHFLNELGRPGTDWRLIAPKMKHLLSAEPVLASPKKEALVASVEATLRPRTSPPGSVEALLDDLLDLLPESHYRNCEAIDAGEPALSPPEQSYRELQALGFEAVPVLIAHLEDERLTRSRTDRFNNFAPLPRHIADLCSRLLQEIAGRPLRKDWLEIRVGRRVERTEAEAWWKEAQAVGEEDYMVAQAALPDETGHISDEVPVEVIRRKYPHRLGEIYRQALAGSAQSAPFADAIGRSSLSGEEKLDLLAPGLASASSDHQYWALRELQKLDPARADEVLLARLGALPLAVSGPLWTAPEARTTHLVLRSESPAVWAALLAAAQRAEAGLRMELMNSLHRIPEAAGRRRVLSFLAAFLHDETVRTMHRGRLMDQGPCAGFTFDTIRVQDFAAMKLAGILKLPEKPEKTWTAAQWEALREKVRAALAAEP